MELSKIEKVSEIQKRAVALNMTGGRVNSVETCTTVLGLKQLHELEDLFLADLEEGFGQDLELEAA